MSVIFPSATSDKGNLGLDQETWGKGNIYYFQTEYLFFGWQQNVLRWMNQTFP